MEPFDLNAIEVNVEMDQNDLPEHIVWNDGRVFDSSAVVPSYRVPRKPDPNLQPYGMFSSLSDMEKRLDALSSVTTGYGLSCRSKNEDGYERLKSDSHIHLIFLAGARKEHGLMFVARLVVPCRIY